MWDQPGAQKVVSPPHIPPFAHQPSPRTHAHTEHQYATFCVASFVRAHFHLITPLSYHPFPWHPLYRITTFPYPPFLASPLSLVTPLLYLPFILSPLYFVLSPLPPLSTSLSPSSALVSLVQVFTQRDIYICISSTHFMCLSIFMKYTHVDMKNCFFHIYMDIYKFYICIYTRKHTHTHTGLCLL